MADKEVGVAEADHLVKVILKNGKEFKSDNVGGFRVWRTLESLQEAYKDEEWIGLDLETTGFSPWKAKIAVIGLYGPKSGDVGILHYPHGKHVPLNVLHWLESFPGIVTHNGAQFDILFLANAGMNVTKPKWYDTMIGEQVCITSGRRNLGVSLKKTVKRRFGKSLDKDIDHAGWAKEVLTDDHLRYVVGDLAFLTMTRDKHLERASSSEQMMRSIEFEMELLNAVVEMELHGIPIDLDLLNEYRATMESRIKAVETKLAEILGPTVSLTSPIQVRKALAARYGEKAWPDTKAERFQDYQRFGGEMGEVCELMLEFRNADTRRKMTQPKWVEEHVVDHGNGHRVHGKFWQVGTDTGRFSSSQPNLQQVPKDARHIYATKSRFMGVFKIDYSQIEVRVAAALARDMVMIEAINGGLDVHTFVASEAFGVPYESIERDSDMRKAAKAMNFLLLFGGGVESLYHYASSEGSTVTRAEIEDAYDRYFQRFSGIARMRAKAVAKAETQQPVTLVYPSGLKRVIMGGELKSTTILNNIVQGTAAFGLKKSLMLARERGLSQYMSAVVHDENVGEAPVDVIVDVIHGIEKCMIDGMAWALQDCPPIVIGVESTWGSSWKGDPANDHTYQELVNE